MKNLVLIAGVSGSGKSQLSSAMKQNGFLRAITSTTRPPRVGEMDGVHYHFVTKELMRTLKEQGKLVESAVVRGEIYGMTSNALDELFTSSENVYVILEPQGVKTYQEFFKNKPSYNVITLFLDCPRQVQVERVLNRLRDGYTEKQLNEVSRALVSAREFEPEWKDMIDINVYYPFSKSSDDIEEIIEKIQKHLSGDLPFDRVATIPPKSSSPNKDEVERVSRLIKSGGFELENFL